MQPEAISVLLKISQHNISQQNAHDFIRVRSALRGTPFINLGKTFNVQRPNCIFDHFRRTDEYHFQALSVWEWFSRRVARFERKSSVIGGYLIVD